MTAWCAWHRLAREELSTWISTACMGPAAHRWVTVTCKARGASLSTHRPAPPQGQLSEGPNSPVWAAPPQPGSGEVREGSWAWASPPANLYLRARHLHPTSSTSRWELPPRRRPAPVGRTLTAPVGRTTATALTLQCSDSVPTPPWTAHTGHPGSPGSKVRVSEVKLGGDWVPKVSQVPPGSSGHTELRVKPRHSTGRPEARTRCLTPHAGPNGPGAEPLSWNFFLPQPGDVLGLRVLTRPTTRPFPPPGEPPSGPGIGPGMRRPRHADLA